MKNAARGEQHPHPRQDLVKLPIKGIVDSLLFEQKLPNRRIALYL